MKIRILAEIELSDQMILNQLGDKVSTLAAVPLSEQVGLGVAGGVTSMLKAYPAVVNAKAIYIPDLV